MGLHNQASDFSSDSILILAVITVANMINHLRSLTFSILRYINLSRFNCDEVHMDILESIGTGLSSLVILAEQLNLNKTCSYGFDGGEPAGSKCVVCLSSLKENEKVRKLGCRHVFHKECLDGWLHELSFSCPLCRSPVVIERQVEHQVECRPRRVGRDLFKFFSSW